MSGSREKIVPAWLQLLVTFVIPIFILTRYSGEGALGPVYGLLLALAFPVGLELYGVYKRRRIGMLPLLAIGGILVTGAIGLLGLSEDWLALRRGMPYAAGALLLLGSMAIRQPLLDTLLPYVLDMEKVDGAVKTRAGRLRLQAVTVRASYMLVALLFALAAASYILTLIVIVSPTGTPGFNLEYARLRLISLPAITLPLVTGITGILYYLAESITKVTKLEFDDILKKRG